MLIATSAPEALAWANRLYEPLRNQSCEGVRWTANRALAAYRAVDRRYPHAPTAHLGAARCLFRMGRYRASVTEYLAATGAPDELAAAIDYARMAARVQKGLPEGHSVQHVVRISRDEWVAATARRVVEDDVFVFFREARLRPFRTSKGEIVETEPPRPFIAREDDCREISLFRLAAMGRTFFVQTAYLGASSLPNEARVVEWGHQGLRISPMLTSRSSTRLWFARGQVWISVTPTYKVWWTDTYGWKNGRISFANHLWPSEYRDLYDRPRDYDLRAYHAWMRYAAKLTIERRRGEAIAAWKEAARCARGEIRETARGLEPHEGKYPDYGYFGDPRENLKEIRQRIAWLRRNDWNHWLLYRPYDWALQVPPFRLGNAISAEDARE